MAGSASDSPFGTSPRGVDAHAEYVEGLLGIKLSGLRTRGDVAVELLAFCRAGHCTAPDYGRGVLRPFRCSRSNDKLPSCGCGEELVYVVDHLSDALLAAYTMGGPRAMFDMVTRVAWPLGDHAPYAESY